MKRQYRKPKWWIPTLLVIAMLGGLAAMTQDGLPTWANEIAGIAIVIIFFGGVAVWLHLDEGALLDEEARAAAQETYLIEEYDPARPWPPEEDIDGQSTSYSPIRSKPPLRSGRG